MFSKQTQRCLSFLLALVVVFSLIPVSVLAKETEEAAELETNTEDSESTITETEEITSTDSSTPLEEEEQNPTESSEPTVHPENNSAVEELQARIDAILAQYGITADMTDEDIANAIIAVDGNTLKSTMDEIAAIDVAAQTLTEAEILSLDVVGYERFVNILDKLITPAVAASVLDGQVTVVDDQGNASESNGTVTMTVKSSFTTRKTSTVTITNATDNAATLEFDYNASNLDTEEAGAFVLNGTSHAANSSYNGTFSALLNPGSSITIRFRAPRFSGTATLVLSNFSLTAAAETSDITFTFDSTKGSIKIAGTEDTDGSASAADVTVTNGIAVEAITKSGVTFLGWINTSDGSILSTAASFTLKPDADMTVKAVFVTTASDSAWFLAGGGTYLFDTLTAANTYASSATNKTIVLANNGTLAAGTYSISTGVTLLIPYAASTTAYTDPLTDPERVVEKEGESSPTLFRKLTVVSGATINCSGNIRVDSRQASLSTPNSGRVHGAFGQIALDEGATLNINSGSTLRAYGYITGKGTVNATSATIYELFQMTDWRGGNMTNQIYKKLVDESFVVSQYYIQNIESTLIIDPGTTLTALVTVAAGLGDWKSEYSNPVNLIGTNGLFNLTSGKITRTYSSSGRIQYAVNGDLTMGSISLKISITGADSISMNSADYVLNLPSNMTIKLESGTTTFPIRAKLLPGTILEIGQNATMNMTYLTTDAESGTKIGAELIAYDYDDWNGKLYTYTGSFYPVCYSPTGRMTGLTANVPGKLIVNGTLNVEDGAAIYSTNTTDGNNALSGNGHISFGSAPSTVRTVLKEAYNNTSDLREVNVVNLRAPLAGISSANTDFTNSLSNSSTYHSKDGYWYQWTVATNVVDSNGNVITGGGIDITGGAEGCIVNGGTFTVTVPDGYTLTGVTASSGTLTASSGTYTLTSATEDVTITVTLKCNHTKTTVENHVDATCDKAGYTGDTVCSDCGETIEIGTTSDALGHSYETVVTAPTCTEAGYTTYTCSACGDSYVDDEVAANGHTWSGTKCTVCGLFKLYATSLRAGDYLDMYFYVKASDLTEGQNYYAHVEKTFADGRDSVTRDIYYLNVDGTQNWETYQNDYLRFSFDDISAKEMTDEIHVTIYDASGNPVSTTTTETIQSYAVRLLSGLTGDGLSQKNQYLRTSLIDMLNYGAAAQDKFSYNTGDLATYGCDAYQEYATAEVTCDAGETDTSKGLDSASVIADNGLTLCLFFDNLNDADLTSLTASVSYTNHYGNAVSWTTSEFNTTNEGLVGVDIVGLAIADGRQLITCEVTNSANEVVASGTYSIERYLASNLEAHDVFSNLMKFIVSAYDYFHS